jgi:hypothetical protein
MTALERYQPGQRLADFCLWDYPPLSPPQGKLLSDNLLWKALDGAGPALSAACEKLRAALGPGQTVYGVKTLGGKLSFEFYFYDYARLERRVSVSRVLKALAPLRCDLTPPEGRPYFMFSLDLDEEICSGRRPLETINVYIGNPGSQVSSGICYEQTAAGFRLANFYFFFDREKQRADIEAKAACSAHHDLRRFPRDEVLRPELMSAQVVVVANKPDRDGVYFSRLPVDPFLGFLRRAGFPAPLVAFAEQHRGELDHLCYDIGFDYLIRDGRAVVLKSAFYGLL